MSDHCQYIDYCKNPAEWKATTGQWFCTEHKRIVGRSEIKHVQKWLDGEREYAEGKWQPNHVDDSISPKEYVDWVGQYMHRALVLDVENPLGRQALAKSLRTLLAFTESVVRRYGPLPAPNVPSGNIDMDWDKDW